jgi:ferredoxin
VETAGAGEEILGAAGFTSRRMEAVAMVSIRVSRETCVGAGRCASTAPSVFDQDDEGLVVLVDPAPDGAAAEAAQTASVVCPSQSITVALDARGPGSD